MKLENAVIFVTGANRGLGREFARQALAAGARKVYAGVRDPAALDMPGVVPVHLDVTDAAQAVQAAAACPDVTLVVNNAGIASLGGLLDGDSGAALRAMFETNVLGILNLSQAFAPVLARNGGGAFLNVLSVVSWFSPPGFGAYAASKSAAWSLTNGLRGELRGQGTQVLGLHVGFVDTDLTRAIDMPKLAPADVVQQAYAALERGEPEVVVGDVARHVHAGLAQGLYLDPPAREG